MKKNRMTLIVAGYAIVLSLCGLVLGTTRAFAATPISNAHLSNIDNARSFIKANNSGYMTYIKGSTMLYHKDAGSDWSLKSLSSVIVTKNNDGSTDEKDACVDISNSSFTFNTAIWANRGNGCGTNGTTTTTYRGGQINVNPPDGVPMALFIRDVDGTKDKQHISFTSSAVKGIYIPTSKPGFDVTGGNNLVSNGKYVNCTGQANCNAIVLLLSNSFNVKAGSRDGNSVMRVLNDFTEEYRTLTFNPNGGCVSDNGTSGGDLIWSHQSGCTLQREYLKDGSASSFPTPSANGYIFLGWYTAASGGSLVSSWSMSSDTTLYAHWQAIPLPNILTCTLAFPGSSLLVNEASTLQVAGSGTVSPPVRFTGTITGPATNQPFTVNGASGTVSFTPSTKGTYTVTATAYDASNKASPVCSTSTPAGDRPYFELSGGDAIAGVGAVVNSGVTTWNTGSSGGYAGGNNNLAVIATGRIDGVITGKGNPVLPALSFASDTKGTATDFGGGLDASSMPSSVSYSDKIDTSSATTIGGNSLVIGLATKGVFVADQDVTVHGTVGASKTVTLIVRGGHNVFIDGTGVNYGAYSTLSAIPRFTVYVVEDSGTRGNIVISGSVTSLHGNYITDGTFYTCGGSPTGGYDYTNLIANPSHITDCTNQLTIYGTVAAQKLMLTRTSGSYVKPNTAAETFKYGPEVWLGAPASTRQYDYYVSLPPIL